MSTSAPTGLNLAASAARSDVTFPGAISSHKVRTGHEVPGGCNEAPAESAAPGVGLDLEGRLPPAAKPPSDGHQAGTVGRLPHAQLVAVAAGPLDSRMVRRCHLDELDGRIAVGPGCHEDDVEARGPAPDAPDVVTQRPTVGTTGRALGSATHVA
jgi:hypothetical protein